MGRENFAKILLEISKEEEESAKVQQLGVYGNFLSLPLDLGKVSSKGT